MAATVDRMQRMIFFALPILFIPFIVNFDAGLVLYWATTNLWTVGQGVVTRRLVPRTKVAPPQKRSSRTPPREERDDGAGDGARPKQPAPKPGSAAASGPPRRVKRKKKRGGARR
jgi:YidC/Oxa1 family membrane protein insertase